VAECWWRVWLSDHPKDGQWQSEDRGVRLLMLHHKSQQLLRFFLIFKEKVVIHSTGEQSVIRAVFFVFDGTQGMVIGDVAARIIFEFLFTVFGARSRAHR